MRTMNPIASMLRHSPFKPMQAHMNVVTQCVDEVPGLFDALLGGDREGLVAAQERIFAFEQEADDIKNKLRSHLPKSVFMPVDRRDLLEVLDMQDSIADTAQDVAGLLVERNMEVLDVMREPLQGLVERCVAAVHQAHALINELDELVETGFSGPQATRVEDMVTELNRIEDQTDELGMALTRVLFDNEDQLKPVSVLFWYQLIQWIGDLADYGEKVGDRLRLLIAR